LKYFNFIDAFEYKKSITFQRFKMQCRPVFIHAQINHQTTNGYKWYSIISLPVLPQNIDMRETRLVR